MQIPLHPTSAATEIARLVRATRRDQGISQEELALAAGVSTKTLHNIETGSSNARVDTLLGVLQALGLTLEIVPRAPSARPRPRDEGAVWE